MNDVFNGRTAARFLCALLLGITLTAGPAQASGLSSRFFSSDTTAQAVLSGIPYDMNDPAWLVGVSQQNRGTFAYKVFAGLLTLGYQTEIAINGVSGTIPQRLALNAFQSANGLPQSNLVTSACLSALDQQLASREQELAPIAQGFPLYDHMQPLDPNDISQDTLAALYTIPMQALPKYLQMATYEEVQCINGQCNGFIQDASGAGMGWPINLSSDFRFIGAYFDPRVSNARLPSAAVHVDTVLHEYAHYLDGFYKVLSNDPQLTKFKLIDTTGFYAIGYDLTSGSSGCYTPKSYSPADWITKYAAQLPGYGNCPAGKAVPDEDWAESFSMYVGSGRDFRAAAQQSALVAQRYNWIRDHVFFGLEYDTDLVRDTESGCNDVYLYGATGVPGYAHCNNNYIWDFTLKPLASSINTVPSAPTQGAFGAQTGVEVSTQVVSNAVTVAGINWPSTITVQGGAYSVNGGPFTSAAGSVNNGDTVTLQQTSSSAFGTQTDALLTVGGVSSSFSVTTRTPLQPTISGSPTTSALTGVAYLFTPTATNAPSFSLSGSLPPGIIFDPAKGTLSGIPTTPGSYGPLVISALNGNLQAALPGFSIAVSAPFGSFAATGSLITGRLNHTATLLSSGKVLAAGGYDDFTTSLASAELYDPSTGTWSQAAPMSSAHAEQSATRLPDGSVLVAGGFAADYATTATAELYDPVAGSWTSLPAMPEARAAHTATLLPNGKVLVTGGLQGSGGLASAALFDPSSNTWLPAASMATVRSYHKATLLKSGKVLITGGYDGDWDAAASAELYDPAQDSWSAAAPLSQGRTNHSATLLPDGTVLAAGGYDASGLSASSAERYDPVADSWSPAASLSAGHNWHTATLLGSGELLVAGGQDLSGGFPGAEVYTPSTDSWAAAGAMAGTQAYHSATLLTDGRLLLAGGMSETVFAQAASQLFTAGLVQDYSVTFSSSVGGSLKGVTSQKLSRGDSSTTVGATAAVGYQFTGWTGTGGFQASAANPLTVANVTADQSITANFAASISGSCGTSDGGVFVSFPGSGLCAAGSASAVTGSGPWSWSCAGSYGGSTANCSASAAPAPVQFTVTPASGSGFSVLPSTPQLVDKNAATSFSVTPAAGYGIFAVTGCGGNWSGSTFTTGPMTADCGVSVTVIARNATSAGASQAAVGDALKVLRAVVGQEPLSAADRIRYDVAPLSAAGTPQGNGVVDLGDAVVILRRSVGIGSW